MVSQEHGQVVSPLPPLHPFRSPRPTLDDVVGVMVYLYDIHGSFCRSAYVDAMEESRQVRHRRLPRCTLVAVSHRGPRHPTTHVEPRS